MREKIIQITVNAQAFELPVGWSITDLLANKGIDKDTRGVAVGINGELVSRANWASYELKPDDVVDVVHAQQGG